MKRMIVCGLAASLLIGVSVARAQTQLEMNQQAEKDFEATDTHLNQVYDKLVKKTDSTSLAKLKKAQRDWVAFRDAESDFHADIAARGGSMEPMEYSMTRATLTKERTGDLERTLKDFDH